MKNIELKRKILIGIGAVFFITSMVFQGYRTNNDVKEFFKSKIEKKEENKIFNSEAIKENKKTEEVDDKAKKTLELLNTIGEAINYIDNNLKKGSFENVEVLIKDSIDALDSINKVLINENNKSNFKSKIDLLKADFEELNNTVKNKDLNNCNELINSKLLKHYNDVKNGI